MYSIDDFDPVQIAHAPDTRELAEQLGVSEDRANELRNEMRKLFGICLATLNQDALDWMDEGLVSSYKKDIPPDTALLQLRDFVNGHSCNVRFGISIEKGFAEQSFLPVDDSVDTRIWLKAVSIITSPVAYRVCKWCGRPFTYKSPRAVFCSDVCRTYAHRKMKEDMEKGDGTEQGTS